MASQARHRKIWGLVQGPHEKDPWIFRPLSYWGVSREEGNIVIGIAEKNMETTTL